MSENDAKVEKETEQNYGELADETLGDLTVLEELLGQLDRGNQIDPYELERSIERLSDAQSKQAEIRRRFEEVNGPI